MDRRNFFRLAAAVPVAALAPGLAKGELLYLPRNAEVQVLTPDLVIPGPRPDQIGDFVGYVQDVRWTMNVDNYRGRTGLVEQEMDLRMIVSQTNVSMDYWPLMGKPVRLRVIVESTT